MRARRLAAIVLLAGAIVAAALHDRNDESTVAAANPRLLARVAMPTGSPAQALSTTWFCAAGTASEGGSADHTVIVANHTEQQGFGTLTIYGGSVAEKDGGELPEFEPVERTFRIGPRRRLEFDLGEVVDTPLASAVVEIRGTSAVVDHQLAGEHGTDSGPCASSPSDEWHFSWGMTRRDTRELFVLFNPFPDDATLDIDFVTDDGPRQPVRFDGFVVPGQSVVGVDVGDDVTRRDHVSATVRARSGQVIVERLQIFDGSLGVEGLTSTLGTPQPAEVWMFPDGMVANGVIERYVVYNPSDRPAEVELEVRLDDRNRKEGDPPLVQPEPFELTIPANSYVSRTLNDEERITKGVAHQAVVRSLNGVPVTAERVIFVRPPSARSGISATPGSTFASNAWVLAAGAATDSIDEWVTIVNPSTETTARVSVRVLANGQTIAVQDVQDLPIQPGGRLAIRMGEHIKRPDLAVVVGSTSPVVVERSLYRVGSLGLSASMGIPLPFGLMTPRPL